MKKILTVLSFLSLSIIGLSVNAQTGTGDDFSGTLAAWQGNSQYTLSINSTVTPGNPALFINANNAGLNWTGFTYSFSVLDLSDNPYVSLKIRTGSTLSLRVDLTDAFGKTTNQDPPLTRTINSNSQFTDYLFDFTGRFRQQYPKDTAVTASKIVRVTFMFNPKGATPPGFTGGVLFDSVMVGSRAKVPPKVCAKAIKLNQLGFFTNAVKKAVVSSCGTDSKFYVVKEDLSDTVYTGDLSATQYWSYTDETVSIADFSAFTTPGVYRIRTTAVTTPSNSFIISDYPLVKLSKDVIKGFYFQRASTALPATYAGVWNRAAGHPDNNVLIHPSAASAARPVNTSISSPRGWYDAGDYNKYIVNSGISTYTLLAAYEHFGTYYDTINLNIPESNNNLPDILDEALWNIRWMLTMQDPNDGGVYHKLTNRNFDGTVMPNAANSTRYVVQKSTAAAMDFAAVMAQAARIFSNFETQLPGLADSCIQAAVYAYEWKNEKGRDTLYNQTLLNNKYPSNTINTGEYGDNTISDERIWAAAELYVTTLDIKYYNAIKSQLSADIPGWQNVKTLGLISLAHNRKFLNIGSDTTSIKNKIIGAATAYRDYSLTSAYATAMGTYTWNFGWGSNSQAANQAFVMLQAYYYTQDVNYLKASISNIDYLLGRNGTGYSFVTGAGTKYSNDPHHRPSQADAQAKAVPGLLVGGPNPGAPSQDAVSCSAEPFPSLLPGLAYLDNSCSFASNEIAINWNAPMVYITGATQSLYSGIKPEAKPYLVNLPTGVQDKILTNVSIKMYPNPSSTVLYIDKPFKIISQPVIFDMHGREYQITGDWNNDQIILNTNELSPGMYLIKMQGEEGAVAQKFTVMR